MPSGTKPLPQPMMIKFYDIIYGITRPRWFKLSLPNTDGEYSTEKLWWGGDELADVDNEFLLQYRLSDIVRETLRVEDVLDFIGAQRFINDLLVMAKYTNGDLWWNKYMYSEITEYTINSLWPINGTWPHRSGSRLTWVMPDGTKPLPEPMLTCHQ